MDTIKKTISLKPYTGSTERDYYQPKPVSDEVRTVAEKYAWDFDGLVEGNAVDIVSFINGFYAGQQWKEEKMKEISAPGEVVKDINNKLAVTAKNINPDGFKFGEKVRVVVIKEEQ